MYAMEVFTVLSHYVLIDFKQNYMSKYLKRNALSATFLLLFILAIIGQAFTGQAEHNQ